MASTQNLNLVKPAGTDKALVSVINSNSDKIDAFAGTTNQALSNVATSENIGAFSTASGLHTALNTLLNGMVASGVKPFLFTATADFEPFISGTVYFGTLYKSGTNVTNSHVSFRSIGSTQEIAGRRTSNGAWVCDQIAVKGDITGYVSNANGKYWRFPDGTQICAKHVTGSVEITTAWGSLYYGSLSLGAWPIAFYSTPTISVTNVTDSGGLLSTVSSFDGAQAGSVDIIRPGSGTYTISVDIISIGRWKA